MPVTTQTFRNQTIVNRVFAVSAVLLALVTVIAVVEDWHNEYRKPQLESRAWQAAYTRYDQDIARWVSDREQLKMKRLDLEDLREEIQTSDSYVAVVEEIAEKTTNRDMLAKELSLFITGNIAPVQQRIEWLQALIFVNSGKKSHQRELDALHDELAGLMRAKIEGENTIARLEADIQSLKAEMRELEAPFADLAAEVAAMELTLEKADERYAELAPSGVSEIGSIVRDAPLMDFFNPSIKVRQQVVPDVLNDLNVMQVRTLDRCMSCHVNIDDPAFEEDAMLAFLEREIARDRGQEVLQRQTIQPVVMLDFWENTISRIEASDAGPQRQMAEAQNDARDAFNRMISRADAKHAMVKAWVDAVKAAGRSSEGDDVPRLESDDDLNIMFNVVRTTEAKDWDAWHDPLSIYRLDLERIVDESLDKDQRRGFMDTYRYSLVGAYNDMAAEKGRQRLSASRLMLAHPNLDLYAHPDSSHPIATMGCTSCHEGSGEETQFTHSAHVPSNIWVDARTGMIVPKFLVLETGGAQQIESFQRQNNNTAAAPTNRKVVPVAMQDPAHDDHGHDHADDAGAHGDDAHGHGDGHHGHATMHDDHYYADEESVENPFGPTGTDHATDAAYLDPTSGEVRHAIKQKASWEKRFGYHEVKYHYWERPMHELRYVESSCARCHEHESVIRDDAPVLSEGRKLFASLGCSNCHQVDHLGNKLHTEPSLPDVRQVGPSLNFVQSKLHEDMIASWIWSPKAYRPNTRMPHYWMLENNSSPLDIRRSRSEVSAIAYYLANMNLPEIDSSLEYTPEPAPEGMAGNVSQGRDLFSNVGCLACHANMNEDGLDWVVLDLQERFGLDETEALARIAADAVSIADHPGDDVPESNVGFFELDANGQPTDEIRADQYNRLQWYLMAYQSERYTRFGPDLSGVATKLLHGRTPEQATSWMYDWLRNPSHYNEYTVMPSFRLTEQEAMDITAYLLTQSHPSYEPQKFEADEHMMDALLVNLQANAISEGRARAKVDAMSVHEKQMDLGHRMIQHYGCYGCHEIPGFDSNLAVSANLSAWGKRDPHKLDFGYFNHVYDDTRPHDVSVWKTYRSGMSVDSISVDEDSIDAHALHEVTLPWEHVHNDRRGYLESKLHNTRIFDRNLLAKDGAMTDAGQVVYTDNRSATMRLVQTEDGRFESLETGKVTDLTARDVRILDVGTPYLKLRMPNFFLSDDQVHSLTTYVTSLKPAMTRGDLLETGDEYTEMAAMGQFMADAFNCQACHNARRNEPLIQQYYEVRNEDGSINFLDTVESLVNAPPRLIGNGAKTQHEWFYKFLNNVEMIRPWLEVRMPSFNLTDQQTTWLVQYLAGQSKMDSRTLAAHLAPVNDEAARTFLLAYDEAFENAQGDDSVRDTIAMAAGTEAVGAYLADPTRADTRHQLRTDALEYELYPANQLPNPRMDDAARNAKFGQIWYDLEFLRETYDATDYPFIASVDSSMSDLEFYRGKKIIDDLKCLNCHVFGDRDKLEAIFDLKQAALGFDEEPFEEDEEGYEDEGYEDEGYEDDDEGYGDDDGYGDDEGYGDEGESQPADVPTIDDNISAPNLALTHVRLQPDYVRQWLKKPPAIMPNTKMPNHWGTNGTVSHFANWGPLSYEKGVTYGFTPDEQVDLIVRWLWEAGKRGYTYDEHVLQGEAGTAWETKMDSDLAAWIEMEKERLQKLADEQGIAIPAVPDTPVQDDTPAAKPKSSDLMAEDEAMSDREAKLAEAMVVDATDTGKIVGLTVFNGEYKPRRERVNNADCKASHQALGIKPIKQELIVNPNRTVANVVVSIEGAPAGDVPDETGLIDQVGCIYLPHVNSFTVGQPVRIRNSDPFAHNLNLQAANNPGFNVGQPVPGMVHNVVFANPDQMRLKCDVHSWMNAQIFVFDHPYHSVSNDDGVFTIDNVPPGDYVVKVWHEELGEQEFNVSVNAGEASRHDLDYQAP